MNLEGSQRIVRKALRGGVGVTRFLESQGIELDKNVAKFLVVELLNKGNEKIDEARRVVQQCLKAKVDIGQEMVRLVCNRLEGQGRLGEARDLCREASANRQSIQGNFQRHQADGLKQKQRAETNTDDSGLQRPYKSSRPEGSTKLRGLREALFSSSRKGDYRASELLLEKLLAERKSVLDSELHYLAYAYLKARNRSGLQSTLERMFKEGRQLTCVHFDMLLKLMDRDADYEAAERVLKRMSELKIQPDERCLNRVVSAYTRGRKPKYALKRHRELLEIFGIEPTQYSFSTLVVAHSRAGEYQSAREVFHKMLKSGIAPNVSLYNSLLIGPSKAGDIGEVEGIVQEMVGKGVKPSEVTAGMIMQTLAAAGEAEQASEVYQSLPRKYGFDPTTVHRNLLIAAYTNSGNAVHLKTAENLVAETKTPNFQTYLPLIRAHTDRNNANSLHRTIVEMVRKCGTDIPRLIRITLVDSLCKVENGGFISGRGIREASRHLSALFESARTERGAEEELGFDERHEVHDVLARALRD
uniref:Pentacotripeptide-repeat region of PRORP domain-containing protein n=1 Tax=Rhodosorus marinus TaxID=101924 RepID=A0A7S3ED57_9RHOD|mmetsp:Transcript_23394/g.92945  ORF Transcript_23394/g.92945 Transcript_23394/m.92945 type:complete len:529 (+) Transcript_23394:290-1876(+)